VWRHKAAGIGGLRRAPAREHLAVPVVDTHAGVAVLFDLLAFAVVMVAFVPRELGDVGVAVRIEAQMRRTLRLGPLAEVLAVRAKDLDAVGFAVTDVNLALRVENMCTRALPYPSET
jgi:hypothetical protein